MRGRLARAGARAQRSGLIPAGAGQTPWLFFVAVAARAHPRRCGADADGWEGYDWRGWLIPAGAGQTVAVNGADRVAGAHPRRCGADAHSALNDQEPPGSSPQVRGRRGDWVISERRTGLIPAGAGQTRNGAQSTSRFWAHPRRCGADQCAQKQILDGMGSSPQVRGRRRTTSHPATGNGLIPAGAGQTTGPYPTTRSSRAHPRRCGADQQRFIQANPRRGSSPQVRGRRLLHLPKTRRQGLIPAGAGQTPSPAWAATSIWAHPRRCGADVLTHSLRAHSPGSSPQVRGRRLSRFPSRGGVGLIPAGAGQTLFPQASGPKTRAHPRRCGADEMTRDLRSGRDGSSPQVRGRPHGDEIRQRL